MPEGISENSDGEHFKVDRGESEDTEQAQQTTEVAEQPTSQAFTEKIDAVLQEPVQPITPESGIANKLDEGEWDPELVKAQTMANVLQQDRSEMGFVEESNVMVQEGAKKEELDKEIEELKIKEGPLQEEADKPRSLDTWGERRDDQEIKSRLYRNKSAQGELNRSLVSAEGWMRVAKERMDAAAEQVYTSYESLYDSNPQRFAEMPTKDFMELAGQLKALEANAESTEKGVEAMAGIETWINELLEAGEQVSAQEIDEKIAARLNETVTLGSEHAEELNGLLDGVREGILDKTTRQVYGEYVKIAQRAKEIVGEIQAQQLSARSDFIEQQKAA